MLSPDNQTPAHANPDDGLPLLFADTFGGKPDAAARAPGRVELIGNHLDYNGGRVAGATIDRFVRVAARKRTDSRILLSSRGFGETVEADATRLEKRTGAEAWANYPLGVLAALRRNKGLEPGGLEAVIDSSIRAGAGLSSSAALELASALAFAKLAGATLTREELVTIGRSAENDFVGVPTGLLDQTTCAFGERHQVVFIDSKTGASSLSPLPATARLWVFTTGVSHKLADSAYSTRHQECREAAEFFRKRSPGVEWLADVSPAELEKAAKVLPAAVGKRARHIVSENARVRQMEARLREGDLAEAGKALFESHASSRDFFENSCPELDFLVAELRGQSGVFGARLTGGGFGGAVLALTSPHFSQEQAREVAGQYAVHFAVPQPKVFACATAPGACLLSL